MSKSLVCVCGGSSREWVCGWDSGGRELVIVNANKKHIYRGGLSVMRGGGVQSGMGVGGGCEPRFDVIVKK